MAFDSYIPDFEPETPLTVMLTLWTQSEHILSLGFNLYCYLYNIFLNLYWNYNNGSRVRFKKVKISTAEIDILFLQLTVFCIILVSSDRAFNLVYYHLKNFAFSINKIIDFLR